MSYCNSCKSYKCKCSSCNSCSCLFPSNSECLKYKGSYLTCLDIANGDVLTDIIVKVNDAICEGIVPASGNIYILESCDSNITVSSETSGNTTTYTICLSDTITDQLTENTTNIASLQTCCDESIKELISSDGSVIVSDNGSGTWDITISNPSGNFWNLEGNVGTDDTLNFIGTRDNQSLIFKVNDVFAGKIHKSDNNLSFGLNALESLSGGIQNIAIGSNALNLNSTGSNNIGIGYNSILSNTSGDDNISLGNFSNRLNQTGQGNIGVGSNTLRSNVSGNWNVAMGYDALRNATGNVNVAIGYEAGKAITSGSSNTAVGYRALQLCTNENSNTSIGAQTGGTIVTGYNNTLIGTNADSSSSSGINRIALGKDALATADYQFALPDNVTTFKWRGITYTMPSVNAAGVLTNDGSGNLTWA